jgi:hypothetical protein
MHHAATSIVATSTRLLSATIKDAKARPNAPDAIIKSQVLVQFRTAIFSAKRPRFKSAQDPRAAAASVGARDPRAAALVWWWGSTSLAASGVCGCGPAYAAVWTAWNRRMLAVAWGPLRWSPTSDR